MVAILQNIGQEEEKMADASVLLQADDDFFGGSLIF